MRKRYYRETIDLIPKQYIPYLFTTMWLLVIAITAWNSEGWLQPDEHTRVLEPAHYIAYGYATLPWELTNNPPVVSWLLGVLVSPILMVTKCLRLTGMAEAAIVRFVFGVIASTKFIAIWRLFRFFKLKPSRWHFYMAIMVFFVYGPLFLVRTSQENIASTTLIWAFYFGINYLVGKSKWSTRSLISIQSIQSIQSSQWTSFVVGILLALTVSFRPQLGVAGAGFWLWLCYRLFRENDHRLWKFVASSLGGAAIGLVPLAVVDYMTTGIPLSPAYEYFLYALSDESGGHTWGRSPWWFYVQQYFEAWYPPLSPLLLPALLVGVYLLPSIASMLVPYTIILFLIGHKEARYFSPMVPMMQLCTIAGIEYFEKSVDWVTNLTARKKMWIRIVKYIGILTLVAGLIPLNSSPWMYDRLGRLIRSHTFREFTFIGNTISSYSQFYAKIPEPPKFKQLDWNDVRSGKESPVGWLVFYAIDPADFRRIEQKCGSEGFTNLSDFIIELMLFMPRSPARNRLNPIIYCGTPLHFNQD